MSFDKFWFKPQHQPDVEKPVEFELKPLDQQQYYQLRRSVGSDSSPSWDQITDYFLNNVSAWKGVDKDCTGQNRRAILIGEASGDWNIWLGEIAGELYVRATLRSAERKNS